MHCKESLSVLQKHTTFWQHLATQPAKRSFCATQKGTTARLGRCGRRSMLWASNGSLRTVLTTSLRLAATTFCSFIHFWRCKKKRAPFVAKLAGFVFFLVFLETMKKLSYPHLLSSTMVRECVPRFMISSRAARTDTARIINFTL